MTEVKDSWLFVPATEKYLRGTAKDCAQNIIYDLEDSLKDNKKEMGLELLANVLLNNRGRQHIYVRVNQGERMRHELFCLKNCGLDGYLIPKFESEDVLNEHNDLLTGKKVIALLETPAGIIHLENFAEDPRLYGFAFGGEDFCTCMGVPVNDDAIRYAREKIVLWAKYAHKFALDTVCFEINDMEFFRKKVEESLRMGFKSRMLIHPRQVEVVGKINECFDRGKMGRIIAEYEKSGSGVAVIDGVVYERPHIERIKKILRQEE